MGLQTTTLATAPGTCRDDHDPLAMIERSAEVRIPLSSLLPAFGLRQAGTCADHVQLLADAASTTVLPPILVQKHSSQVIDGMHRVEAARLRGDRSIAAHVVDCTDEEALILAVMSNTLHGLPLSKRDRVYSAKRILEQHPDWSDRAVAGITGLSPRTVASLRGAPAETTPLNAKRLGRDGRRRPVFPSDGRRRAAEYIKAHPEASVRETARASDVSVGTAQVVIERMRGGHLHPVKPVAPPKMPRTSGLATSDTPPDAPTEPLRSVQALPCALPDSSAVTGVKLPWASISPKLTKDPSMRYTDGGRAFLRWMALHSAHPEEWREFIDAVPQRWLADVRRVALSMSEDWRQFADQLRHMMEDAT
jgi:hypothetical protein